MDPLVTFLVPAYHAMPFIRETVRSMQAQTLEDFLAIVINDGSSDGTAEYLDSIDDSRFQIIHQENSGYVAALNRGSEYVTTRYFARLDADDISLPCRLEKQVAMLERFDDLAVVSSATGYIFGMRRRFGLGFGRWRFSPSYVPPMAKPPFRNPSTDGQTLTHSAVSIRTSMFRQVGGYRELAPAEDTDLWLRLHDKGFRQLIQGIVLSICYW